MLEPFSYPLSVHLDDIFNDKRSHCKLLVSSTHLKTVGDFLIKIRKTFEINDPIDLYVKDAEHLYFVPPSEDIRILQPSNDIVIKRHEDVDINWGQSSKKKKKLKVALQVKNHTEKLDTLEEKQCDTECKETNNSLPIDSLDKKDHIVDIISNSIIDENIQEKESSSHDEKMETSQDNNKNKLKKSKKEKAHKVSYSSTSFKNADSVSSSRKHSFTQRQEIKPMEISTAAKIIQSIRVPEGGIDEIEQNGSKNLPEQETVTELNESYLKASHLVDKGNVATENDDNKTEKVSEDKIIEDDYFEQNFTTDCKRKRKRHRKKTKNIKKQVENAVLLNCIKKNPFQTSAPIMHFKFDENCEQQEEDDQGSSQKYSFTLKNDSYFQEVKSTLNNLLENELNARENLTVNKNKPQINILDNIKICDPFTVNLENKVNDTPAAPIQENNQSKNASEFKDKCKHIMSTAMQKAISSYFKDISGAKGEMNNSQDQSENSEEDNSNESSLDGDKHDLNQKEKNLSKTEVCNNFVKSTDCEKDLKDEKGEGLSSVNNGVFQKPLSVFFISETDILKKPLLRRMPKEGDVIAFKSLMLNEDYTPTISKFITADVLNFEPATKTVRLRILTGADQLRPVEGKFSIEEIQEEENFNDITFDWRKIIQPRLLSI